MDKVNSSRGRWTNSSGENSVIRNKEVAPKKEAKGFSREKAENLRGVIEWAFFLLIAWVRWNR